MAKITFLGSQLKTQSFYHIPREAHTVLICKSHICEVGGAWGTDTYASAQWGVLLLIMALSGWFPSQGGDRNPTEFWWTFEPRGGDTFENNMWQTYIQTERHVEVQRDGNNLQISYLKRDRSLVSNLSVRWRSLDKNF